MVGELITTTEAEQDIAEAYAWYENRQIGLGEEFLSCLDVCMEAIRRIPEVHVRPRGISPDFGATVSLCSVLRI